MLRFCKGFPNNSSANIKLSKPELPKIGQSLKIGFPLIKNVLKPLVKSVLIPLGLAAAAPATDAALQKKICRSV